MIFFIIRVDNIVIFQTNKQTRKTTQSIEKARSFLSCLYDLFFFIILPIKRALIYLLIKVRNKKVIPKSNNNRFTWHIKSAKLIFLNSIPKNQIQKSTHVSRIQLLEYYALDQMYFGSNTSIKNFNGSVHKFEE